MNIATILIVAFIMLFLGVAYKLPFIGTYVRQIASAVGGHKKAVLFLGIAVVLVAFGGMAYLKGVGLPSFKGAVTGVGEQGIGHITGLTGSAGDTDGCTFSKDGTRDRISVLRCTDDQSNTTSHYNMTITSKRDGSKPMVCDVTAWSSDFSSPSDVSDSNVYNVLKKDSTGKFYVYILDAGTKTTVTTDSSQQDGVISFSEGDGETTVGIALQIDETSTDELNAYDVQNIYIDFKCKQNGAMLPTETYTIEYLELDAAA